MGIFNKKNVIPSFVFSFLFALLNAFGFGIAKYLTIFYKFNLVIFLFLFVVSFIALNFVFSYKEKFEYFLYKITFPNWLPDWFIKTFFLPNKKCFLNNFILISVCYLFYLLIFYPAIAAYDYKFNLNFFLNRDYLEIHPVLYNLILYFFYKFGMFFKNLALGISLYSIFQIFIMASSFSYCIYFLSKYKVPFLIRAFALLFFALHPYCALFSISTTKDAFFCSFVLIFIIQICEIFLNPKCLEENKNLAFLTLTICFMFLFRHNAFLSYIIYLPFLIFGFKKLNNKIDKSLFKRALICFLVPIIFYFCFGKIKAFFNITPPPIASTIAIPLQQMSRVRVVRSLVLTKEEKEIYKEIVSKEKEDIYVPYCIDWVKLDNIFSNNQHSDYIQNSILKNPKRFLNLYFSWMKKYPSDYIDAILINTSNYWNISAKYTKPMPWGSVVAIENEFYEHLKDKNPDSIKKKFYNFFETEKFEKNIVLKVLFSMPYNFYFIILSFILLFYKKRYDLILALGIIPALFLTALLAPAALLRYVYQNFIIVPLIFSFCFSKFDKN